MSEEQIKALAKEAAREAVRETFYLIGIDVQDRDDLNEWLADRAHMRRLRVASEARNQKLAESGVLIMIGALATAAAAWFKGWLNLGGH